MTEAAILAASFILGAAALLFIPRDPELIVVNLPPTGSDGLIDAEFRARREWKEGAEILSYGEAGPGFAMAGLLTRQGKGIGLEAIEGGRGRGLECNFSSPPLITEREGALFLECPRPTRAWFVHGN